MMMFVFASCADDHGNNTNCCMCFEPDGMRNLNKKISKGKLSDPRRTPNLSALAGASRVDA